MPSPCPVCGGATTTGLKAWHYQCGDCTYEGSSLQPRIQAQAAGGDLDEVTRESSLETLRKENFRRLRALLERVETPAGRRLSLLDVGCAHGWFIEECQRQFDVIGIEPDLAVAKAAQRRGLPVRAGYFPDEVEADERFDVISFNDVLEHIPDLAQTLQACHRHLRQTGLLVVNAPSRLGAFYRLSRLLARLGMPGPFERLWQNDFPSPHVHYFDTASMSAVAARYGFRLESRTTLPSISVKGLYARIRYSRHVPAWKAGAMAAAITLASPLLAVLPADINVWTFRRVS